MNFTLIRKVLFVQEDERFLFFHDKQGGITVELFLMTLFFVLLFFILSTIV